MKSLVVYFSHKGENIVNSEIKYLEKGYTEILAEAIAKEMGSDIFRLVEKDAYPEEYEACSFRARNESEAVIRPEVISLPESIEEYDTIYIGFPIWYRSFPRIIYSFIKAFDFTGKIIKPFSTNEEGFMGYADLELPKALKNATVKDGFACRGYLAESSIASVLEWAKK